MHQLFSPQSKSVQVSVDSWTVGDSQCTVCEFYSALAPFMDPVMMNWVNGRKWMIGLLTITLPSRNCK